MTQWQGLRVRTQLKGLWNVPYYHVRIWLKESPKDSAVVCLDLTLEDLESRVLVPRRQGLPITLSGKTMPIEDIDRIKITVTEQDSEQLYANIKRRRSNSRVLTISPVTNSDIAAQGNDVTDEFITGPPGSEVKADTHLDKELMPPADAREVFVVHGRNEKARQAIFAFLRSIGLHPLEWSEAVQSTGRSSPYIGDILNAAFSRAHAVVVLMTPDDDAQLRKPLRSDHDAPHETELSGQARPNVLFEAGMAMGRSEDRTILVELGTLRPFSDIAGRHVIRLDNTTQRRQELAQRLKLAGCPVNLNGIDWHSAGDFAAALDLTIETSSESAGAEELQSTNAETSQLSEEAQILLIEATKGESGFIQVIRTTQGMFIRTSGKALNEMGNRRSEAKWEGALENLLKKRFVKDYNGKGTAFEVTHKGFEFADRLGKQKQSVPEIG